MKLLPYDRLTLLTTDEPAVVAARLAHMVAVGWFIPPTPPQPFRGTITATHFKVARVLGTFLGLPYWNSFLPLIVGDIVPSPRGTEVRIRMRLHALVGAFTALWFGALFFMTAFAMSIALRDGAEGNPLALLASVSAIGLFGYALVSISFWSEAKKARALLREGLGCHEVVDRPNRLVRSR